MKKTIVAAIVGGIIIFAWQFITWGALNLHKAQLQYTPKQDSILSYLSTQFKEDGAYMLPCFAPGTSRDEMEKQMKAMDGKPWAQVVYHKSMPGMSQMPVNMARALLVDIFIILLLCWFISKMNAPSFATIFLTSLGTGCIIFMNMPYTMHIWYGSFDLNIYLIDALISWSVTGLWLGWWLRRK